MLQKHSLQISVEIENNEEKIVEQDFIQVVKDMNFNEQQIQQLLRQQTTIQQRKQFIELNKQKQQQQIQQLQQFIRELKQDEVYNRVPTYEFLQSLYQSITTSSLFQAKFQNQKGLLLLFNLLEKLCNSQEVFQQTQQVKKKEQTQNIQQMIIQIIRRLMDTELGLTQTIRHPGAILSLFRILFSEDSKISTVKLLSKIIATLAILPRKFNSIPVILSALDQYSVIHQNLRFGPIVFTLNKLIKETPVINSDLLQIATNFYILFTQFSSYQVNQNIKARIIVSQQLNECDFKEIIDKNLAKLCMVYIKQIVQDKNDEFSQQLKTGQIDLDSLIDYIQDYYGTTPDDSFRRDSFVQQIITFLSLRKELWTKQQNDQYEYELLNEQYDLEDDNQDETLESVNDKFIQQIEYDNDQIKQSIKEMMYDMSTILNIQNEEQNELQNVYIFESLKNYTKSMIQLKQECQNSSLEKELQKSKGIYENLLQEQDSDSNFGNYIQSLLSEETLDRVKEEYKYKQTYLLQNYRFKLVDIETYTKCEENEKLQKTIKEQQQLIQKLQSQNNSQLSEGESVSLLSNQNEQLKQRIKELENQLIDNQSSINQSKIQQVQQVQQQQKQIPGMPNLIPSFMQTSKPQQSTISPPPIQQQSIPQPPQTTTKLPPPPSSSAPISIPPPPQSSQSTLLPPPPIPQPGKASLPPPPINNSSALKLPPPPPLSNASNIPIPPPPGGSGSKTILPPPNINMPPGATVPSLPIQPQVQIPKRESINIPQTKLKSFFIDKIKPIEYKDNTIWKQIPNQDIKFTDEQKQKLEQIYKEDSTQITEQQQEKQVQQKPKIVTLLEAKKQQSLGILMQKFKLSAQNLYDKVLQLQPLTSKEDGISQLISCQISNEDIKLVINSGVQFEQLGKPEQFCFLLQTCKSFNQRLKNWLFIKQFKVNAQSQIYEIKKVGSFFDLLFKNKDTEWLMRLLLSVSNFINNGTPRGGAAGFKCKTLQKFTQKCNNKLTLIENILQTFNNQKIIDETLNKIYDQIERNQDINKLQKMQIDEKEELSHYIKRLIICYRIAKKCSWQDVKQQTDSLIKRYQEILQTVNDIQSEDQKDVYKDYVNKFDNQNKELFQQLQKSLEDQTNQIQDTQQYFCEGRSEYQEFLTYWEEFINSLELYLKQQQKVQQQQLRMQEVHSLTATKSRHDLNTSEDNDQLQNAQGLMDQLMVNFLKQKRF